MTDSTDQGGLDSPGKGTPSPWGYYYLRYFVGAIVGAGLLVGLWMGSPVLQTFPHTRPPTDQEWLNLAASITALGTAGLAYCYIASAPILLMHGFRLLFSPKKWFWSVLRVAFVLTVILLGAIVWHFGPTTPISLQRAQRLRSLLYVPYGLAVALQILCLLSVGLAPARNLYNGLAHQRARAINERWVGEYVESYRHLREHGNALLIILMEVILAAALYAADTLIRFFTLAVIWIIPAAFSWFFGTWLEFGIVSGKSDSGSPETPSDAAPVLCRICNWRRSLRDKWEKCRNPGEL